MTFVITQSCCSDATCVLECPVDCIRPTPGDPEFVNAEMLYIDPDSCIDCGACQEACPVSAVYPEEAVPDHLRHFIEFNAGYFLRHPLEPSAGVLTKPEKPKAGRGQLTVAIVGSGPAAAYLAEDLLQRGNVKINMIEKLPTPWGLLRSGVAPDHLETKDLSSAFERAFKNDAFEYFLNVEVGRDIAVSDLVASHHAVVLATGAADPAIWQVPGAHLDGVHPATEFVGWYNGHPDGANLEFDLSCERVVIIGNGNVALDVARILLLGPDDLKRSDIAEHARAELEDSRVKEVVVVGRRGPLQAAYTAGEFTALSSLPGVEVVVDPNEVALDAASRAHLEGPGATYSDELKVRLAQEASERELAACGRRLSFRYLAEPTRVYGGTRVEGVEFRRNDLVDDDGQIVAIPGESPGFVEAAGLVLTSIGYRGRAIHGVPFDEVSGRIPTTSGRITDLAGDPVAGLYAAGWAKRGASGGIGAGRADAHETAAAIVADFNQGLLPSNDGDLGSALARCGVKAVSDAGWRAIDDFEKSAGIQAGRPRIKIVDVNSMLEVASPR